MYVLVTTLALASAAHAIGFCDNAIVKRIMETNGCPTGIVQHAYDHNRYLTYRVLPDKYVKRAKCFTGEIFKPESNVAQYKTQFTFNKESGMKPLYDNYHLVEAKCGLSFKYEVEKSYLGYKIAYFYFDDYVFGYYGCTNEITLFPDEVYGACVASSLSNATVEASLAKCKAKLHEVTGSTDFGYLPTDCP